MNHHHLCASAAMLVLVVSATSTASPRLAPVARESARTAKAPTTPVGLITPLYLAIRGNAGRAEGQNNLKQIMLAIHSFHDANGRMPADIKDKDGKAILSWRVEILPYLEQQAVYNQFKLDQPWDSPANKEASKTIVKTFQSPQDRTSIDANGYGVTNYLGVAGKGTAFEAGVKLRLTDFTDGTSNTIVLVESAASVPWAKPADFELDLEQPLPNFLFRGQTYYGIALGDGSVGFINPNRADPKDVKAMMTRNGGEVANTEAVLSR